LGFSLFVFFLFLFCWVIQVGFGCSSGWILERVLHSMSSCAEWSPTVHPSCIVWSGRPLCVSRTMSWIWRDPRSSCRRWCHLHCIFLRRVGQIEVLDPRETRTMTRWVRAEPLAAVVAVAITLEEMTDSETGSWCLWGDFFFASYWFQFFPTNIITGGTMKTARQQRHDTAHSHFSWNSRRMVICLSVSRVFGCDGRMIRWHKGHEGFSRAAIHVSIHGLWKAWEHSFNCTHVLHVASVLSKQMAHSSRWIPFSRSSSKGLVWFVSYGSSIDATL